MANITPNDPSESPDIMNGPSFGTPRRRDTISSATGSERVETCRICRSEGSVEEPLFYPCKCSGSIKFVHQSCLMEWLSHSHKKYCELCKTPFRFTKLYDANMPSRLPWMVFTKMALIHTVLGILRLIRTTVVATVWLVLVPWLLRWAWRWMFWIADAAWARDAFMDVMQHSSTVSANTQSHLSSNATAKDWLSGTFRQYFIPDHIFNATSEPFAYSLATSVARTLGFGQIASNASDVPIAPFKLPQADTSILTSWTYLSSMTSNARTNRFILDVCEGQLITSVVIVGFILIFLIREWVVQQQPLVDVENINNVPNQLRGAVVETPADNDTNTLQGASGADRGVTIAELEDKVAPVVHDEAFKSQLQEFGKLEGIEEVMDRANELMLRGNGTNLESFYPFAIDVTQRIHALSMAGLDLDEVEDKLNSKVANLTFEEQHRWREHLRQSFVRARGDQELRAQIREQRAARARSAGLAVESTSAQIDKSGLSDERAKVKDISPTHHGYTELPLGPAEHEASRTRVTFSEDVTEIPDRTSNQRSNVTSAHVGNELDTGEIKSQRLTSRLDDPFPITNAGPDAKINIKRCTNHKGKAQKPPSKATMLNQRLRDDELKRRLNVEADTIDRSGPASPLPGQPGPDYHAQTTPPAVPESSDSSADVATDNHTASSFQTGPETHANEDPVITTRNNEVLDDTSLDRNVADAASASGVDSDIQQQRVQQNHAHLNFLQRLGNWFWGDIPLQHADETLSTTAEERRVLENENGEIDEPFVPVHRAAGVGGLLFEAEPDVADPEVVAAAAQAGLDAEAIEDAEDLEGILELIGLQGPIIGLFQTSAFCTLLVGATLLCAVFLPYTGGKLILSLIGSPVSLCLKGPLQLASLVADVVIDLSLILGSWVVVVIALSYNFLTTAAEVFMPKWWPVQHVLSEKVLDYVTIAATNSTERLRSHFITQDVTNGIGWSWILLAASAHSHASLNTLRMETDAVLSYTGHFIDEVVDIISSDTVLRRSLRVLGYLPGLPAQLISHSAELRSYVQPSRVLLTNLRRGALTFETTWPAQMDPMLVYWDTTDRTFAIIAGYITLAALAAVYVALDTPITKSEAGRKTERLVRDTLRQAGGVFKVILIISIEMLVFPLYCGLLLDVAFLPLFNDGTVAGRWRFAVQKPYTFCFVHWFIGTCYMFHFALFVGMCRKILRKGVLWFIRDPDDPTFHPVRDVLERGVLTQLRKIAFSGLVYGALVILCLGGVIWTIGKVCYGIFPVYWISTEPILEFPLDLLLYNLVTPFAIRLSRPSDAVQNMYEWWLRRCARLLRLSHFLFDDRRADEEGHHVRGPTPLNARVPSSLENRLGENLWAVSASGSEVQFERNGKYALTPCSDQYRPPKAGEAFLHIYDDDMYIADKDGKRNEYFAKVYIPPLFPARITMFMICLWVFTAAVGLGATLVPLVFGRHLLAFVLSSNIRINDIYAYSLGSYIIASAVFFFAYIKSATRFMVNKAKETDFSSLAKTIWTSIKKGAKCVYVYGFLAVLLPFLLALVLQLYIIVPLHSYALQSTNATLHDGLSNATSTSLMGTNGTHFVDRLLPSQSFEADHHIIHILQDYALGLLYVRIAAHYTVLVPDSRPNVAFQRVTAEGYLNPNARLATRFFILPIALVAAILLLMPPILAQCAIVIDIALLGLTTIESHVQTMAYRYSYPIAGMCSMIAVGLHGLIKATARWRSRIRDEVYLVGERLHNFSEKRQAPGNRGIARSQD